MEEKSVDTKNVFVRQISKVTAKKMIETHHYSHSFSSCRYALGIYHTSNTHEFFFGPHEELIGCLVYGHPVGSRAIDSISDELTLDNVLELTRLFVHEGYGRNIESYVISQSFYWLRKRAPNIKILISYADPEQSHLGRIYQATNWIYQGIGYAQLMPNYSIRTDPEGSWIHSRTVGSKFGSRNIDHLKKVIGKTFWRKLESPKHRYVYILGQDKRERKKLFKSLKYPPMDYPKDASLFKPEVETIEVTQNREINYGTKEQGGSLQTSS